MNVTSFDCVTHPATLFPPAAAASFAVNDRSISAIASDTACTVSATPGSFGTMFVATGAPLGTVQLFPLQSNPPKMLTRRLMVTASS
ncbi:hypothetical protein LVJ94_31860 [Pendulispora rubella]|uniref:Uncharacterized protein n=1 Tax=Pendulispora rubella TaxID=2741070 RepID=A0ABZ2KSK6_9BACT